MQKVSTYGRGKSKNKAAIKIVLSLPNLRSVYPIALREAFAIIVIRFQN